MFSAIYHLLASMWHPNWCILTYKSLLLWSVVWPTKVDPHCSLFVWMSKKNLVKALGSKNNECSLKMNCDWQTCGYYFFHPPQQNIKRTKCHRGLLFYCPNDRIIDIHRLNQSSSFFVMFFSCHMEIIKDYFQFLFVLSN